MNHKALRQGDPCPAPVAEGKLRMYQMRFCPFCDRARLVLAHKNIECELINIDLDAKPDWYLEKQPNGKVPCLEFPDGRRLYDSAIVCEFLDAAYPENKLTPSDPYTSARQKLTVDETFGKAFPPFHKATYESKGEDKESLNALWSQLERLEKALDKQFLGGESPSMADFMVWPLIERLEMVEDVCGSKRPANCFPRLMAYIERMQALQAVKTAMLPSAIYIAHAKVHFKGDPCPAPVPEGKLRMYQMRFCPFCERARLVLAHKNIECELVNIDLSAKPDWYLEKQPRGWVPCLELPDGQRLYSSVIVCDFLDAAYPENKLTPTDPLKNARQKLVLEEFCGKDSPLFNKATARSKKEDNGSKKVSLWTQLQGLENLLTGQFFGGKSPSMLDFMIWPWMERLEMVETESGTNDPSVEGFPRLAAYIVRMLAVPAVKTLTEQRCHRLSSRKRKPVANPVVT